MHVPWVETPIDRSICNRAIAIRYETLWQAAASSCPESARSREKYFGRTGRLLVVARSVTTPQAPSSRLRASEQFRDEIVQFAERQKLPAVYGRLDCAPIGLVAYGIDRTAAASRAADVAHRIKGPSRQTCRWSKAACSAWWST